MYIIHHFCEILLNVWFPSLKLENRGLFCGMQGVLGELVMLKSTKNPSAGREVT